MTRTTLRLSEPDPEVGGRPFRSIRAPLDEKMVARLWRAVDRVKSRQDLKGRHRVYVALLRDAPHGSPYSFYVGMTGLTAEQRYRNQKAGIKAGRGRVRRYGIGLLPELVDQLNPMSSHDAEVIEKALLWRLCEEGFHVYGG